MKKIRFFKLFFSLGLIFVVAKVYQHNQIIKLNYEKQFLEERKQKLYKKKNELLVVLNQINDHQEIKRWAEQERGMCMTTLSRFKQLTEQEQYGYDFVITRTENR